MSVPSPRSRSRIDEFFGGFFCLSRGTQSTKCLDERPSVVELGQSADPDWISFAPQNELLPPAAEGAGVTMETVVIVAIGVLATIFLASFIALVVVCRHRYCHPHDLLHHFDSKPTVDLIGAMETQSEQSELELDDVVITNPHIEAILENEDWIEDASGLVSHCISILKICHTLTEKLVAMTMGSGAKVKAPASLSDIITVAKRISPRVDDVVRSMYPPLDPILLDARATALLLSVSHLVLVTRNACHMSGSMDWIDQSLHAAEDHMVVLREAALASEPERSMPGADAQREQAI